jgi:hypothetical protein
MVDAWESRGGVGKGRLFRVTHYSADSEKRIEGIFLLT